MTLDYSIYMSKAIELAKKTQYQTDPNPIVGALLVAENGEILSEGYHVKAGMAHAEVVALKGWDVVPQNATLFVTLEPCCIYGKTPPCVDLVIEKQVKNVVIGCLDPNPRVAGRSVEKLKQAGINVVAGMLENECMDMNRVFNKHIVKGLPFVAVKSAFTLDGQISMPDGSSKWITCEQARYEGHRLRSRYNAILVGKNTLLVDNPRLTDRVSDSPRQPVKVAVVSDVEIPEHFHFLKDQEARRMLFSGSALTLKQQDQLEAAGVEVFRSETVHPEIKWILKKLYSEGICSVLVEGGGEIISSFIRANQVDRMHLFVSGKIIGGNSGTPWVADMGFRELSEVPQLQFESLKQVGDDIMLEASLLCSQD